MSGEQQDPATGSEQGEAPEELAGGATTPEDPAGEALVLELPTAATRDLGAYRIENYAENYVENDMIPAVEEIP